MKNLRNIIRKEVRRTILEARMRPGTYPSLPDPSDFSEPQGDNEDIWVETKADELYEKILAQSEAFYEAVTKEMIERARELKLHKHPDYPAQALELGKGVEKFSEFLRDEIQKFHADSKGIIQVAQLMLNNAAEKLAQKAWDDGEAHEDTEY